MKRLLRAATVVAALTAVAVGAAAANARADGGQSGAVFVQTNELSGNHVAVFARGVDGTLTPAGTYATGGLGGAQVGAVVDKLASQGSLAYDANHQLLFAVNAGSDTLSVFAVDGTALRLVQVVPTNGDFPSSVGVSGNLVYVLNAGGAGSVQGFRIDGNHVGTLHDGRRSLGLANTPTPFFLTSPGEVGFSPDGSKLIVTTKGSTNSIDVFAVNPNGSLSTSPVVNPAATPAPFAFTFDAVGRLVSAEAGVNALTTYTIGADGTLAGAKSQGDGQAALCWVTAARGAFYVANAGSSSISGYTVAADGTPSLIGATGVVGLTEAGAIDMVASPDGRFLYAESGGAATVDTFAVNGDHTLTKLQVTGGLPAGLEGIAAS
jgi:6-phosphogluconolactonase (cycloisomerase 2 family)